MPADKMSLTLQENLLVLLAHSNEHGKIVANLLNPQLFEGDYRTIAERCVDYWARHKQAPRLHTPDLLADILEDKANKKAATFRRILHSMLQLNEHVNSDYVLTQLRTFTKMQKMKDAILKSAERLQSEQDRGIAFVEEIWNELLHSTEITFESGTRLTDVDKMIAALERKQGEFLTGIPILDKRSFAPERGTVLLLIAPAGKGKSWGLIHLGKMALLRSKKVLHISLEMSEEQCQHRYYQSFFAVPKRKEDITITTIQRDAMDRIDDLEREAVPYDFAFNSEFIREELENHVNLHQRRFKNIIIKQFPPNSLTANSLRAYMDNLEISEHFIPDLVILDYIGIMRTDSRNYRVSIGQNLVDFRSIMVERNMAGATAQQSSKEGAKAKYVTSTNVAEDWSLIGTADRVLTYSRTAQEGKYGLARLYASKSRGDDDDFAILITQSYKIGQFVLDSVALESRYWRLAEQLKTDDDEWVEGDATHDSDEGTDDDN